jgi:hypothetical protein
MMNSLFKRVKDTKDEARDFITHINEKVIEPYNVSRYGEKLAKKHKSIAKNLYVAEDR